MPETMVEGILEVIVAGTEEVVGAITGDTLTATGMATMADMDMVIMVDMGMVGGVILMGGAILIGEVIPMGGVTLIGGGALIITPTTVLTTMRSRRLHKKSHLQLKGDDGNLPIGTSVKIQKVTTPMLKVARVVGWLWCRPNQMLRRRSWDLQYYPLCPRQVHRHLPKSLIK